MKANPKILFFAAIMATCLLVIAGYWAYRQANPQQFIGYQQFTPSVLPQDLSVTYKELEVWPAQAPWAAPHVRTRLDFNRPYSYMVQEKYDPSLPQNLCDLPLQTVTCTQLITPKNQTYAYQVYHNGDTPYQERVSFVRHATSIQIEMNIKDNTPLTTQQWGSLIDGLQPTIFSDLTVKNYTPGP